MAMGVQAKAEVIQYNIQTLFVGSCEKGFTNWFFDDVPFDMFTGHYRIESNLSITMIYAESADVGSCFPLPTYDMTTNKSYLLSRCAVPQRPRPEGTSSQQWGEKTLAAHATAVIFLVSLLSSKATEALRPMTRKGISEYFWQAEDDAVDEIPRAP